MIRKLVEIESIVEKMEEEVMELIKIPSFILLIYTCTCVCVEERFAFDSERERRIHS